MKYDSANLPEVSAARNYTRCTTLCEGSVHTERKRFRFQIDNWVDHIFNCAIHGESINNTEN